MAKVGTNTGEIKQRLRNIDPYEFEEFVGDLWSQQGWDTRVSQASNDMGVDVVAERDDGVTTTRQAIQVKRYSEGNKIGRDDVQQYYALKVQDSKADSVVVVTTSSFTTPAEEWAEEHNVKLVDGDDLVRILKNENALAILDDYAPPLRESELDPAPDEESAATPTKTDELGVDIEGKDDVILPEPLADEDTRQKVVGGAALVGVLMILNPWGIQLPVEALGAVALVGAGAIYKEPEAVWDLVTPTREVYVEYDHGGIVALDGDTIQYEPPGEEATPKVFGNEDEQRARQRAAVYGALDNFFGGTLPETDPGVLPTAIANEGERMIAAYRFAVHDEDPSRIASEMSMSQQEVIDNLRAVVK